MPGKLLFLTVHRWRDAPSLACFTWPSDETTVSQQLTSDVNDSVVSENKMPNWRDRITRGLNATTAFLGERRRFTYHDGYMYSKRWCGGSVQRFGHIEETGNFANSSVLASPSSAPSQSVNNEVHGRAMMRFIREARAAQGAFRGATWFAELADTIRTIRNPARSFRRGIDDYISTARRNARRAARNVRPPVNRAEAERLLRSNPRAARAMGRAVTDTWLEYQFGWQPLVSDIGNGVLAGLRLSRRLAPRKRVNALERMEAPDSTSFVVRTVAGHEVTWEVIDSFVYSVLFYGAVKIEVDSPTLGGTQEFGVRLRDWAPALWEVIPYSFLIDYFTNIGDIVEVLSFPKSDIQWVSRTIRNSTIRDGTRTRYRNTGPVYPANNAYVLVENTPCTYHWERTWIDRHQYSVDGLTPRLILEIPGSQQFKKYLNMGALAAGRSLR